MRSCRRGIGFLTCCGILTALAIVVGDPGGNIWAQDAPAGEPQAADEAPRPAFDADMPPVVVKTLPALGDKEVDPALEELKVTFDRPMDPDSYSWVIDTDLGARPMKYRAVVRWEDDERTCVLAAKLRPGTLYAFGANSVRHHGFRSVDGRIAVPHWVVFRTAGQRGVPVGELP